MKDSHMAVIYGLLAALVFAAVYYAPQPETITRCVEYKTVKQQTVLPKTTLPCPSVGMINTCGGINIGNMTIMDTESQTCVRYETIPNPKARK